MDLRGNPAMLNQHQSVLPFGPGSVTKHAAGDRSLDYGCNSTLV